MPKRKSVLNDALLEKHKSFKRGRNEHEAECLICTPGTYISVANKGALDLEAHESSRKHKTHLQGVGSSTRLTNFFLTNESKENNLVCAAEGTLAFHAVRHHHSFNSMDCTSKLHTAMYKDSTIAKQVSCARTKAEAIVTSVLAPHSVDITVGALSGISCFSVATDGSNHGPMKVFPILIQYFDTKAGGINTKVIEMKCTPNEKSETIATYIKDTLQTLGIEKKVVAFTGDNTNTNFGGIGRAAGNNVLSHLKKLLNSKLIGMGCPAHVLHNCVQHGFDSGLKTDIDSLVLKIFNYFSIYTVRTEELKEFCDFVEVNYQQLLYHTKTRWLSLFPCIERLIHMFPALKSYFLSQSSIPVALKTFFEDELSEARLLFVHSLMSVFNNNILNLEKESNSVAESISILESTLETLEERNKHNYTPLKIKAILTLKREEGYSQECDSFVKEMSDVYRSAVEYLQKWMAQYQQFTPFRWMQLSGIPVWGDVENCIVYLNEQTNISIDDTLCFDQFCNFIKFLKDYDRKQNIPAAEVWCAYFSHSSSVASYSELLKIAEFFFSIPGHNANTERVFSLMNTQWTKDRNRLKIENVKAIVCVQYNFKHFKCLNFYQYLLENKKLLREISSSTKYSWFKGEKDKNETVECCEGE